MPFVIIALVLLAAVVAMLFLIRVELERTREWITTHVRQALVDITSTVISSTSELRSKMPPPRARIEPRLGKGIVPVSGFYCSGSETIAPGAEARIKISPTRWNYCIPHAVSFLVHAEGWPALEQRAFVRGVFINQFPQMEPEQPIGTEQLTAPPGHGIPVSWGPFSIDALIHILVIVVHNPNPYAIQATAFVWGEMRDQLPAGTRAGENEIVRAAREAWEKAQADSEIQQEARE